MASADVIEVTDQNFETEILNSESPALVDFWAVWCGPCKQIAPTVEALATEYKGRFKIAKMDIDKHQQVPQKYSVRSIPTLLVFKGGLHTFFSLTIYIVGKRFCQNGFYAHGFLQSVKVGKNREN